METQCQVWHWCLHSGQQFDFLCPNGTVFNQVTMNFQQKKLFQSFLQTELPSLRLVLQRRLLTSRGSLSEQRGTLQGRTRKSHLSIDAQCIDAFKLVIY